MLNHKKQQRYRPGPGDPAVPPQLADFHGKTSDEVLKELNKMPFFMTKLDDAGSDNVELEALKALAYEGEPDEVAENFKSQGNDLYKAKRFKDARIMYTKAINVKPEDKNLIYMLYLNRAACELELKNYRRSINDCKTALESNPNSPKAFYRISKSFFKLNKFDEALQSAQLGSKLDPNNQDLLLLARSAEIQLEKLRTKAASLKKEKEENERLAAILETALSVRNITSLKSKDPSELLQEADIKLENAEDIESQLVMPAMVLYPMTEEFDFIASVSELTTVAEILEMLLDRPPEWFEKEGHQDFIANKLVAYMETLSGGLVKVGKNTDFYTILGTQSPVIPLFDNGIRLYVVPKAQSNEWVSNWSKELAIKKRFS
ncbi:HDR031Wp [Eremothecium sinecaudum]|uniref:HDR031Wp n=1 Tax=Eremothecium sinecaudum TaxID=45286 RepID=A0A0X8HSQ2_9SACH|nr:HDR031Wp [Eremothecium sinecaudum]AMD20774.1 HDR031Wp [Eremothecium sinecaudum]